MQWKSLQFNFSVMSNSLWPHGLQHARLPCPSPTPRFCSNSCPLSWWCHPTISSCHPFSSCLRSFPASGSFLMSQFFTSSGQSIGASASVLQMNIQGWSFRIDCNTFCYNHVRGVCMVNTCRNWSKMKSREKRYCSGDAGDRTRGLIHAKHALYHWATSPSLLDVVSEILCYGLFFIFFFSNKILYI